MYLYVLNKQKIVSKKITRMQPEKSKSQYTLYNTVCFQLLNDNDIVTLMMMMIIMKMAMIIMMMMIPMTILTLT